MKVLPGDGGCWFCEKKSEDMLFCDEFDTYVHDECVREKLKEGDFEAKIMAIELGIKKAPTS